jgi:LuxR family transcriptional regulator, maltose regulon positive regulatory protein
MSHKTPLVEAGLLREVGRPAPIAVDSPEWFAWLADEQHQCFHYAHASGGFTARKERKQRGQWYWVAYRQIEHKLHKLYLGKADALTEARLRVASESLAHS